jgi:hypothetical protein
MGAGEQLAEMVTTLPVTAEEGAETVQLGAAVGVPEPEEAHEITPLESMVKLEQFGSLYWKVPA